MAVAVQELSGGVNRAEISQCHVQAWDRDQTPWRGEKSVRNRTPASTVEYLCHVQNPPLSVLGAMLPCPQNRGLDMAHPEPLVMPTFRRRKYSLGSKERNSPCLH